MTRDEIIAMQAREKVFTATPLGAAFRKFKSAHAAAWIEDTKSGYSENIMGGARLDRLWKAAEQAERELRELLEPLATSVPDADDGCELCGEPIGARCAAKECPHQGATP